MISVESKFKFDGGEKYKSHNFSIYEKNEQNTYENFCKIATENYLADEPNSRVDGDLYDKMGIHKFNSECLEDTMFKPVATRYRKLVKELLALMKTNLFIKTARPWPGNDPLMAMANGNEISQHQEFDYLSQQILDLLLPIISKNITNFYCVPWYTTFQRNHWKLARNRLRENEDSTAFQWHFDGVPKGTFKLFIYASEVEEDSGPFCYMVDRRGDPIKYETGDWQHIACDNNNSEEINPPRSTKTRFSLKKTGNMIIYHGCTPKKVMMPQGSFMVWNPNHLHRAAYTERGTRETIQFHMRPTLIKPKSYWLGTNGREHHVVYKHDWWLSDHKLHSWGMPREK